MGLYRSYGTPPFTRRILATKNCLKALYTEDERKVQRNEPKGIRKKGLIDVWKEVEKKGAEKLKKVFEAYKERKNVEEFKTVHSEYVEYLEKISEITGITDTALDTRFLDVYLEEQEGAKE